MIIHQVSGLEDHLTFISGNFSKYLDPRDVLTVGWMIHIHVFCFGKIYLLVSTSVSENGTPYQIHRLNNSVLDQV